MVLLSRIYSMPRLDVKTKLPLLTPKSLYSTANEFFLRAVWFS